MKKELLYLLVFENISHVSVHGVAQKQGVTVSMALPRNCVLREYYSSVLSNVGENINRDTTLRTILFSC